MRFLGLLLAVSVALAIVATGCGGEDQSAEEKWADSVCSDVADWKDSVEKEADDVKTKLQSPQAGTLAAIDADVRSAADATNELADELSALDPPDSESGEQAKQQLDALAAQLESTVTKVRETVESLPSGAGLTEIAEKLAPIVPELQSLAVKTSSTLAAVQESSDDLKEGFEKADSCDEFRTND